MGDAPVMLVTGARKGIGRFLAEYYLGKGYRVAGCSRGASDLEADGYRHYEADEDPDVQPWNSSDSGSQCQVNTRVSGTSLYNDHWLDIDIDIPITYTCGSNCWWSVPSPLRTNPLPLNVNWVPATRPSPGKSVIWVHVSVTGSNRYTSS